MGSQTTQIVAPPTLPALEQFLRDYYGGRYRVKKSTVTVGTSDTQVVGHNFERMSLQLINTGANDVHTTPGEGSSTTNGILLGSTGGILTLSARDDLILVGWEWFGTASTSSTTLTVIEVLRYAD